MALKAKAPNWTVRTIHGRPAPGACETPKGLDLTWARARALSRDAAQQSVRPAAGRFIAF
jgi:hypothetical protein